MISFSPKILILIGIIITIIGIIWWAGGDKLFGWFGKLPGDIRVEKEGIKFYFPVGSMLLVSLVFNVLWRLVKLF